MQQQTAGNRQEQQMSNWKQQPATDKQYGLIRSMASERDLIGEVRDRLDNCVARKSFTKGKASEVITWLTQQPKQARQPAFDEAALELAANGVPAAQPAIRGGALSIDRPGVFEKGDAIYVVKQNRAKTRMYAKRLTELRDAQGDRLTDAGGHVRFDFEYAAGAIYDLSEQDRMPESRAKDLHVRYGRCLNCGRTLKVAESLERGVGPVCAKSFRPGK
jgi:hypothetical protein